MKKICALRFVLSEDREEYENKSRSLQSTKVEPCLFEVHNRQTVALNITREILNCGTRGEKVSHSSGGCHTVVRPTSPGKFPAWGGLARTLATLATYPFLTYVTTRSRTYLGYPFLSYVPVPPFLIKVFLPTYYIWHSQSPARTWKSWTCLCPAPRLCVCNLILYMSNQASRRHWQTLLY